MKRKKVEKVLALVALVTAILAGILGIRKEAGQVENNVASIVPEKYYAEAEGEMKFSVYQEETNTRCFYIIIEPSNGYGGEMDMAILVDTTGYIVDLKVIKHRETPSYLEKVKKKGLIKSLKGKAYSDPLIGKEDISVVSGATYTSEAIINSARIGSRKIASENLGYKVPDEVAARLIIGVPEIVLIILYIIAFISIYSGLKFRKQLRWLTMLTGLVVLGFWFAVPLSLAKINTFLLGFWPDWHLNLYWYLLVFGFVITILTTRKNIYCNWICPLGCMQDILGLAGDAKPRFSGKINRIITWISRLVIWLAVILALYYRNPVKLNYEIFGVAVNLTGASYLFAMTGIFFIASVFISRPWCNYLCPATPLYDFLKLFNPPKKGEDR